ncbi:MAG: hypothetical protein PHV36_12730, partial [Elusimicrobiales bacterium]|nr:hypothetical protein [Elusimicrobiales bacterium]
MNTKRIFGFLALAAACALSFNLTAAAQTTPSIISFQGRLTDNLNNPLAGSYNFDFAIYATPTGGSPLWNETQLGVTVANGVLTAELGSVTPIAETVFASAQRYLEITVNGTTLAPRQRLLSVPYAMNAQTFNGKAYDTLVTTNTAQAISGAKTFSGQTAFLGQVTISSDVYLSSGRINLQGNLVTTAAGFLDATKLANAVPNSSLDTSSVTKRGNSFNGAGQLVLVDASGKLPAIDGSQLINVAAGSVSAATVQPGTFVSGVLLPAAQVQAGSLNSGVIVSSLAAGAVYPANLQSGIYNIGIFGNAGTVTNGVYTTATYNNPPWLTGLAASKIDLSTVTAALAGKLSNSQTVPSSLIDLSTVTAVLDGKLSNAATVPPSLLDFSTITAALDGKISGGASIPQGLVDLSTVAAALALKADSASVLSNSATVPAGLIDLSTITAALAGKATTGSLTVGLAGKLSNTAGVPPGLIDLSTVTTALAGKATTSALTLALAGKLSNTAPVPANLVDLSTVTAALAGKISAAAPIPSNLIDLSTVTAALAERLSNTATVPSDLIDLSTVTAALAGKASASALTLGLAGKLSNTVAVPANLVDLSTVAAALAGKLDIAGNGSALTGITAAQIGLGNVSNVAQLTASSLDTDGTMSANSDVKVPSQKAIKTYIDTGLSTKADAAALSSGLAERLSSTVTVPTALVDLSTVTAALAGKLSTNGSGAALTGITAANISSGKLGPAVVASSLAVNSVYAASIQDGALSFAKIGLNNCGPDEVLRRNIANTLWICGPDQGGTTGTFTLAPASPLNDASGNASLYVNDTGGGNFMTFQEGGVDRFTVDNSGRITAGGISAGQITAGPLSSDVIASSVAVSAVYPDSVQPGSYNISILGNAASVSNGIYSNGSYSDPAWITSLATSKIDLSTVTAALSGRLSNAATVSPALIDLSTVTAALGGKLDAGAQAASVANGVYTNGAYANPAWITSLDTSKINLSTVAAEFANLNASNLLSGTLPDNRLSGAYSSALTFGSASGGPISFSTNVVVSASQFRLGNFNGSPSTNAGTGAIYYDTSDGLLRYSNGSTWTALAAGGASPWTGGGSGTVSLVAATDKVTMTSTAADALKVSGGITAGSGNVGIVDTTGRIPALNSTYISNLNGSSLTGLTASMVGLGNVNNTSDANKPISTAQQTAIDLKANLASPTFTGTVSGISASMVGLGNVDNTSDANKPVSSAQLTALNAKAVYEDVRLATSTLRTDLNLKASLASPTFTGTVGGITASMVGLGNVNNTSDVNKPVSTPQQTAIDLKANLASPTFTGTVGGISASMVGLGNVDNTSDANKPVSSAQLTALNAKAVYEDVRLATSTLRTDLDLKANLASPTFTGTVGGITSSMVGLGNVDNTSDANKPVSSAQLTALNAKAVYEDVRLATSTLRTDLDLKANLASPTFTGTVGGISASMIGLGNVDNTSDANKPVSTAQQTALDLKANLASPTFTGTVGGVTASMVGLGNVSNVAQLPASYLDTDTALATNSDVKVASQKAAKAYIDSGLSTKLSPTGDGSGLQNIITSTAVIVTTLSGKYDAGNFVAGNNYLAPNGDGSALQNIITSTQAIVTTLGSKYDSGNFVSGTNYLAPNGDGSSLQNIITSTQAIVTTLGSKYDSGNFLAGTHYQAPLIAGTNYLAPNGDGSALQNIITSTQSIVTTLGSKYDSGNFVSGTNYLAPNGDGSSLQNIITSTQAIVTTLGSKYDSGNFLAGTHYQAPLVAGTNYLAPNGDGSSLQNIITSTQAIVTTLGAK